jgi:negative regulator of sigma E activity
MHPADLETFVDTELRRLPLPRAPLTLLPRVLAAVQQWSRRPWYARAWFTWPLAGQIASAAALMLIVVASAILIASAQAAVYEMAARLLIGVTPVAQRAEAAVNAARVVWRVLIEPLTVYAFVWVVLMCLACAAFGTALNHVAFRRAVHS